MKRQDAVFGNVMITRVLGDGPFVVLKGGGGGCRGGCLKEFGTWGEGNKSCL